MLADLKGKKLAADMGSGQYQILTIYARSVGLELGKDIEVINANFAASRAQLAAERVDAAMIIEPIVSAMVREDAGLRIIFNADDAWKKLTGSTGWELVFAARDEVISAKPEALKKLVAALQDTARYMKANPKETDKIASRNR
jgi:ABC-type nitrate/sulfonate/bicarbonate transport system substrate-binding protein